MPNALVTLLIKSVEEYNTVSELRLHNKRKMDFNFVCPCECPTAPLNVGELLDVIQEHKVLPLDKSIDTSV